MLQLKLEPSAAVEFFHDPAMVVLVVAGESPFCVFCVPSFVFACHRREILRTPSCLRGVVCRCVLFMFYLGVLLVVAPVDSRPGGTERIQGMLGSVGCRIYRATPITVRFFRWMDPTPPMLVPAVHSWCVCAMSVLCVSRLLLMTLPAIPIFFCHRKKSSSEVSVDMIKCMNQLQESLTSAARYFNIGRKTKTVPDSTPTEPYSGYSLNLIRG